MYLTLYFCHVFVSRENGTKIILLLDFKYGFSMVKTDYIASVVYFGTAVGWLVAYNIILGAYVDNLSTEREKLGDFSKIVRIAISILDKWQNAKQKMNATLLPANLARDVSL